MRTKTGERSGGWETGAREEEPDFKWAVEWLVQRRGQRRAASLLGVDRKTVALALRRKRLTARMTHAVQTLMARVDDPEVQEVMPLDRMESQIRLLLESMGEVEDVVEGLTRRVKALEEAQSEAAAPGTVRQRAMPCDVAGQAAVAERPLQDVTGTACTGRHT